MKARNDVETAIECERLWNGGDGKSKSQIAAELEISIQKVREILRVAELIPPRKPYMGRKVTEADCVQRYGDGNGKTVEEAAEQLGCPPDALRLRLRAEGKAKTPREIGAELGCAPNTVLARLRSAGVTVQAHGGASARPDVTAEVIIEKARQGNTVAEIAAELRVSDRTVLKRVDGQGVFRSRRPRTDVTRDHVAATRTVYHLDETEGVLGCSAEVVKLRERKIRADGVTVDLAPGTIVVYEPADEGGVRECHRMKIPDEPLSFLAVRLSAVFSVQQIACGLERPESEAIILILAGIADGVRPGRPPIRSRPRLRNRETPGG